MDHKLISVVIPTYNRASLIIEALDSVYNQSYRPLQLIVVDDGSTDTTHELVTAWIAKHAAGQSFDVRLISQQNAGGNAARNQGITASSGQFIAFLDSDDLWLPHKLRRQITQFDDPQVGAVYCGLHNVDLSTGRTSTSERTYPAGWILPQLLVRDVTAPTSTFVVRKEVFHSVGSFDLALHARQDWDMWIRIASQYKIEAVPQPLVRYRHHAGPRTATDPDREIRAYQLIRQKYKGLLSQQPPNLQRAAKASFYKRMGRVHFHYKRATFTALRYYVAALYYHPRDFDTWAATLGLFLPTTLRQRLHHRWNRAFAKTPLAIRSH